MRIVLYLCAVLALFIALGGSILALVLREGMLAVIACVGFLTFVVALGFEAVINILEPIRDALRRNLQSREQRDWERD
jgi:hypothetical protein